ncbi:MAG: hypothetical protein ACP5N7_04320 [Candidatus Pacearchaeota archaeon]
MKDYTDEYVQVVVNGMQVAYAGYVKTDKDSDFLTLLPFDITDSRVESEFLGTNKDKIMIVPLRVDIAKKDIKLIYVLPTAY